MIITIFLTHAERKGLVFLPAEVRVAKIPNCMRGFMSFQRKKKTPRQRWFFVYSCLLLALTFHMYDLSEKGASFVTSRLIQIARTCHMHQLSFTQRGLFTRTSFPSQSADFSLPPGFLYMARNIHMHQLYFRWRELFPCTRFPLHDADFSLASDFLYKAPTFHMYQFCFRWRGLFTCPLLYVSFRLHIHQISFRRPCFFTFSNCPRDGAELEPPIDSADYYNQPPMDDAANALPVSSRWQRFLGFILKNRFRQ